MGPRLETGYADCKASRSVCASVLRSCVMQSLVLKGILELNAFLNLRLS